MYADISKPPAPLPQARPQQLREGITLLPPLSRRGHGPGLIILQQDSSKHLDIIDGVPSALVKWAEEGYVVVGIQAQAISHGGDVPEVMRYALEAMQSCDKLESQSRSGIIAYDSTLWNAVADVLGNFPSIVGGVVYANSSDEEDLRKAIIPVQRHMAGQPTSVTGKAAGVTTCRYARAKSFRFATPFQDDFDYWAESLSHTRNLTFLKPLMNGPYFDLESIWDEHTYYEFADRSVEHTMSTMVDQPYVNHVPTLTGGIGRAPLTQFYRNNFIFSNSDDTELELISRTIGIDRIVDEFIYKFTHNKIVDWLVPGIPPTFKYVEVPFTAVEKRNSSSPSSSCNNQDAIMEILSSLQGQLNSLASRVQTSSQSPPEPTFKATDCNNEDFLSTLMNDATAIGDYVGAIEQNWQNPPRPIYGLPSPDNSLNASSQSQSQAEPPRGSFSAAQSRHPPHLNVTSDIEFNEVVFTQDKASAGQTQTPACDASALLKFRGLMSLKDARRLLGVYQEVIGDLHPIVDIDEVQTRARNCYTDGDSTTWEFFTEPVEVASEDDLLILNLALLIGLHADATPSKHESESIIRESIQPAISSKLAAPRSTMNGVIIVLLKGAYDFFNDTPQSAWRMCGTAGRMLMELGFHNGVMSEDMLDSRAQRAEVWALMSSIVILDRQWSAAAGLPRNFQESAFGPINTSSIKLPYLEAMLTFIKLSDKFSDPISQATKSQRYDDEEAFEVMNFRIEQWRKRAVADPSIIQLWHSNPLSQPPTWKILLNLRAESVRSLLFKPHFFSKADVQTSKQYLRPAIEVLFDVCNVLYNLNTTTDIYRKQQPFYQPLLASASGLGFVLTSFLEHNRSAVLATLSTEVAGAMGRSYEMAVALATGSRKSNRLGDA
ncbi:hypothetical protein CGCF413_v000388 [Colletotrichum fructicola]|nr:hypothetical protein CGCF413_v000388 [Colletotrichum fructicola]